MTNLTECQKEFPYNRENAAQIGGIIMAIHFLEALTGKYLRCPSCGSSRITSKNYQVHFKLGGLSNIEHNKVMRGDSVTLICDSCIWEKRTHNWRQYLLGRSGIHTPPPTPPRDHSSTQFSQREKSVADGPTG